MKLLTLQQRLAELVDERLRRQNFRRRRFNWFRSDAELYRVCNLQKSEWGNDGCYINIGFSPSDQTVEGWLAERLCWLRFRMEAVRALRVEDLRLIDANTIETMGEDSWSTEVAERIVSPIADILLEPTDLASLDAMLRSKISTRVLMRRELRELLQPDSAADTD